MMAPTVNPARIALVEITVVTIRDQNVELPSLLYSTESYPEAERLKIEGYLTRKWGLMSTMFTAAHPYYSSDPYQPTVTQGGEDAAVTFYWGDNNGSTTAGNWDTIIMQYLALMVWAWYHTQLLLVSLPEPLITTPPKP
jgi:hypothetical protein